MNKKGFTLTELLAVIVVLAILIGIGTQVAINIIAKTKAKTAEEMGETLKDAAITYCIDNYEDGCTVSVDTLKNEKYFDDDNDRCNNVNIVVEIENVNGNNSPEDYVVKQDLSEVCNK